MDISLSHKNSDSSAWGVQAPSNYGEPAGGKWTTAENIARALNVAFINCTNAT